MYASKRINLPQLLWLKNQKPMVGRSKTFPFKHFQAFRNCWSTTIKLPLKYRDSIWKNVSHHLKMVCCIHSVIIHSFHNIVFLFEFVQIFQICCSAVRTEWFQKTCTSNTHSSNSQYAFIQKIFFSMLVLELLHLSSLVVSHQSSVVCGTAKTKTSSLLSGKHWNLSFVFLIQRLLFFKNLP